MLFKTVNNLSKDVYRTVREKATTDRSECFFSLDSSVSRIASNSENAFDLGRIQMFYQSNEMGEQVGYGYFSQSGNESLTSDEWEKESNITFELSAANPDDDEDEDDDEEDDDEDDEEDDDDDDDSE
jgi:hypothetical protein